MDFLPPKPMQPTLFEPFSKAIIQSELAGRSPKEVTEEAIQRSANHADPHWMEVALFWLQHVCQNESRFTVDVLCEALSHTEAKTHDNSALGPVMQHGAKQGWMRKTGEYVKSKDPKKHCRVLPVWESLLR